jgi:hypothetical protein
VWAGYPPRAPWCLTTTPTTSSSWCADLRTDITVWCVTGVTGTDIHDQLPAVYMHQENMNYAYTCNNRELTLWRRSLSKCYLRIQSVPQRDHHTSPLQRSTG